MAGQTPVRTFKALSALLTYPGADLVAAIDEIEAVIDDENLLRPAVRRGLQSLLHALRTDDLLDLQERYVELFDRSRRLSLHLFEHIHGESRDRGQAMIDLVQHYERGGLLVMANELPDYLPLFLEFLSTRPPGEARSLLAETSHVLSVLDERVQSRNPAYGAVFTAILSLAGDVRAAPVATESLAEVDDLAALDAEWEETAVAFGPGMPADGCSVDRLRIQMRAARRDARHSGA
ncbi:MAG TPA: nitrate reductase molybdenum cofactor assembly chaperone [Kaistia sp.]|nr:nitrate reductase molybdenum cofactor assembly chaperone [Kaistia sp.]